jgi:hypothetical protein
LRCHSILGLDTVIFDRKEIKLILGFSSFLVAENLKIDLIRIFCDGSCAIVWCYQEI